MGSQKASSTGALTDKISVIRHVRLVWRLLSDERISLWRKAIIPVLALAYLILPLDLVPDVFPVLGQLDDLAVLMLGMQLFIQMCPRAIVQEHLEGKSAGASDGLPDEDVIDATYRVIEEDDA